MKPRKLTLLGATGSIGQSTLDVLKRHPEQFELFAVTAFSNVADMLVICKSFRPEFAVMVSSDAAKLLAERLRATGVDTKVLCGTEALSDVASAPEVSLVMSAIVGAAGLLPTLAAIKAGKKVMLANKEALVMSGQLFVDEVKRSGAQLLPVDSEHNAIFQALPEEVQKSSYQANLADAGVSKILLTGSGGPFRQVPIESLGKKSPDEACAHPNWDMGRKISVDSATMVNKGLEYIEARWLFNCNRGQLDVILHPQSVIHSMVEYIDGSVIAQLGEPDMRTPIAYAMGYPDRLESGVNKLNFRQLSELTFAEPCSQRYPCLQIAIEACWNGQAATTALNAANEVAVDAFLSKQVKFTDIAKICELVLASDVSSGAHSIDDILACDKAARMTAKEYVRQLA